MLQRVGKENNIGFLSMDYNKLANEIKEIKESREHKPEKAPRLTKQTSGNMYAQKAHTLMNFLNEGSVLTPDKKLEQEIKPVLPKKLDNDFSKNPHLTDKSIFSTRGAVVGEMGGPSRQIKTDISNSIWDPNRLQSMVENRLQSMVEKESDNEQKTIAEQRQSIQDERMDELVDNLKSIDQRKASNVTPLSEHNGSAYKLPEQSMSIFDTDAFARLPEKTAGEKISERRKEEKEKIDDSWRSSSQVRSTKDVVNDLFDKLSSE